MKRLGLALALVLLALPGWADVGFDAATESVRTGTENPYTFDHTPSGTPRGIVLTISHGGTGTDVISNVTYGGVTMTRLQTNNDGAIEVGRSYVYFLGSSIPTGTQTVSAGTNGDTADMHFVAYSLTANDDTESIDADGISGDAANPSVTLQYTGRVAIAIAALYGGGSAPSAFTPNGNCSTVHDHDLGAFYSESIRQTTPGSSDFAIGGTAATDDVAFSAVAIAELAGGGGGCTGTLIALTGAGCK